MENKLLVADGNEITRYGLAEYLGQYYAIDQALSNNEAQSMLNKNHYDLVLIDYSSANFSLRDMKLIIKLAKEIKIIAITSNQSVHNMAKALQLGVDSHLKKTCDFDEIMECIKTTLRGGHFICGEIIADFKRQSIELNELSASSSLNCSGVKISQREIEVIKLIAEGNSAKQIAKQLYLSNHTINTHRKNIFNKLNISSTSGLVIYAVQQGIVDVNHFVFGSSGFDTDRKSGKSMLH